MTDIIPAIRMGYFLTNHMDPWAGLRSSASGPQSPSVKTGPFVVKMEFLLGNPYSTPVGQCIGTLALKLFSKSQFVLHVTLIERGQTFGLFR